VGIKGAFDVVKSSSPSVLDRMQRGFLRIQIPFQGQSCWISAFIHLHLALEFLQSGLAGLHPEVVIQVLGQVLRMPHWAAQSETCLCMELSVRQAQVFFAFRS
jgi:hypothetical protein